MVVESDGDEDLRPTTPYSHFAGGVDPQEEGEGHLGRVLQGWLATLVNPKPLFLQSLCWSEVIDRILWFWWCRGDCGGAVEVLDCQSIRLIDCTYPLACTSFNNRESNNPPDELGSLQSPSLASAALLFC